MEEIRLEKWQEFGARLQKIVKEHPGDWLFRGHGDAQWQLETTLERFCAREGANVGGLLGYYRRVAAVKPILETASGKNLDEIPSYPELLSELNEDEIGWLDMFLNKQKGVYEYFVYLRHHGFPSPLLDWTASPYVAAFFAFDDPPEDAERVAVYAFQQRLGSVQKSDQHVLTIGPYLRTDQRHYRQQSRYSMCASRVQCPEKFTFRPHEAAIEAAIAEGRMDDGVLMKITIPTVERSAALRALDSMNINRYSLFDTEDALAHTLARRELVFRNGEMG